MGQGKVCRQIQFRESNCKLTYGTFLVVRVELGKYANVEDDFIVRKNTKKLCKLKKSRYNEVL